MELSRQNNSWTEMLRGDNHTRVQSNLVFQPLISLRLTEKQGLMEAVAELFVRGFDLTRDEIDLLCRTDAGVWFLRTAVRGAPQHILVEPCAFSGDCGAEPPGWRKPIKDEGKSRGVGKPNDEGSLKGEGKL